MKAVFVCVPKTASQSMRLILDRRGMLSVKLPEDRDTIDLDRRLVTFHHAGLPEMEREGIITRHWLNQRWKFGFVRNPWDRMVSLYYFLWHQLGRHRERYGDKTFPQFVELVRCGVDPVGAYNWRGLSQANPQTAWTHPGGKCVLEFIGRFESIQADWQRVFTTLGLRQRHPLPKTNATGHKPFQEYYTPGLRDAVGELYKTDVETYGYRFD